MALDVLVVEDAVEYAQVVTAVLRQGGHRVRSVGTIATAIEAMNEAMPELVVLDLALPDGDGLDLCRVIHERSNSYILMLTGRNDEIDKLVGFRLGADDYVTKPFSPRELAARIEALSRRPRQPVSAAGERTAGAVVLHPASREVLVNGAPVDLTRIEFDLLDVLTANPRTAFTRQQLVAKVWGDNWICDDHVVDVHVANLRKKLRTAGADNVVQTLRGVGYRLAG